MFEKSLWTDISFFSICRISVPECPALPTRYAHYQELALAPNTYLWTILLACRNCRPHRISAVRIRIVVRSNGTDLCMAPSRSPPPRKSITKPRCDCEKRSYVIECALKNRDNLCTSWKRKRHLPLSGMFRADWGCRGSSGPVS